MIPDQQPPDTFNDFHVNVMVDDEAYNLQLWDTAGQEEYKKLRPLSYLQTDVFVICFSLVNEESLENVEKIWIPELKEHCPEAPYILVGLHSDRRDKFSENEEEYKEKGWVPVPKEKGEEMKNKIGAADYIECSVDEKTNVKEVFQLVIKASSQKKTTKKASGEKENENEGNCCLLL